MNYPIFIEVTLRNTDDISGPKRIINACHIVQMIQITIRDEHFTNVYFDDGNMIKVKEEPVDIINRTRSASMDYIRMKILTENGVY